MEGRFDVARSLLASSNAAFEDLGGTLNWAGSHHEAIVEMLAGDHPAAERSLYTSFETLQRIGDKAFLSTTAAFLAQAVFAQGRLEEAESLTAISEEMAATADLLTQIVWRGVRAKILARGGRHDEADVLAREALALAELTDFISNRADSLIDFGQVLQEAGRRREATDAFSQALRLYEQKGNVVRATSTRSSLAVLSGV
jgi:tetratricopeptide (TPR) repeat protein